MVRRLANLPRLQGETRFVWCVPCWEGARPALLDTRLGDKLQTTRVDS